MYLLSNSYFRYLGKSSLEKIPLFGYMYKKLYITVNRRDKQSRGSAFTRCQESINEGVGIAIYPEGAIPPTTPKLIHFKDGAFRLSIDNNIPLVPITMPFNHKVLPVGDIFRSRLIKIIVHPPLNTSNHPYESVRELKDVTYSIIENELNKHLVIA